MIISVQIETSEAEWAWARDEVYARAEMAIQREYRRQTGSRRLIWAYTRRIDSQLADGSGVNVEFTMVGLKPKNNPGGGHPILATGWAYIRNVD
jgi:hypothetical protein